MNATVTSSTIDSCGCSTIDGVRGSLDGQQGRAPKRKGKSAGARDLGPGENHGRADAIVEVVAVVGSGEGRLASIRLTGHGDPVSGHRSRQWISGVRRRRQHPADDKPQIARLVDQIGLIRSARRSGALKRENRSRDHIPGPRPRPQQPGVGLRGHGKAVAEYDQGKRSPRPCRRSVADIGPRRRAGGGITDHRHQRPGP
jgi:hypothetical protein